MYQLVDDVLHRAVKGDVVKGVRLVDHHLHKQKHVNNSMKIILHSGRHVGRWRDFNRHCDNHLTLRAVDVVL